MNEGRMLYELLSQLTDEQICEKVENFISDEYGKLDISEQEKVSEIEYLCDKISFEFVINIGISSFKFWISFNFVVNLFINIL